MLGPSPLSSSPLSAVAAGSHVGIAGTLDPQVLGATSVANVSTLTSLAVVSKFDQLWGFIEQYREAHPPGPPPFPGLPIPSPVRTTR